MSRLSFSAASVICSWARERRRQGLRAESGPFFQSDFTAQSAKLMIHMCAIKIMGLIESRLLGPDS